MRCSEIPIIKKGNKKPKKVQLNIISVLNGHQFDLIMLKFWIKRTKMAETN